MVIRPTGESFSAAGNDPGGIVEDLVARITEVLARFAEAMRPEPRTLTDEEASLLLREILDRRRQLIGVLVAENNRRLSATSSMPVRKHMSAHVRWLEQERARTDRDLDEAIAVTEAWRENEALSRSAPGVGPVLLAPTTLLAELGALSHRRLSASLVGVAPFNRDSSGRLGDKREV